MVQIDHEEQVTFFLGRYGTTMELYDKKRQALMGKIRKFLKAVLDGRYDERVRLGIRSEEGELGNAQGVFHFGDGDHRISYSNVGTLGNRGPWQQLRYAPY